MRRAVLLSLSVAVLAGGCGQMHGVHARGGPSAGLVDSGLNERQAAALATAESDAVNRQLIGFIKVETVTRVPGTSPRPVPVATGRVRLGDVTMSAYYLALYQQAAATCPGLPWTVLAAIGTVESNNGQSQAAGVHSGANFAGAEGPMQFLPPTFAEYALPVPPGGLVPPSPYDPVDAIYAASRDLCANGGRNGRDLPAAIFAYNHATWYVREVLTLAADFAAAV